MPPGHAADYLVSRSVRRRYERSVPWVSLPVAVALATCSGVIIMLAEAPTEFSPLAWVALVPLLVAQNGRTVRGAFVLATLSGTVAWTLGYPWIAHMAEHFMGAPAVAAWALTIAHGVVMGLDVACCLGAAHFLSRHLRVSLVLTLPIATVAVWSVFPNVFFSQFAHMSVGLRIALQPMQWTGAYGLDAVILLSNALFFEVVRRGRSRGDAPASLVALGIGAAVLAAWWIAGAALLSSWDARVDAMDTVAVGVVQPHRGSVLGVLKPEPGYTREYPVEMEMSEGLVRDGARLVVWPEGHNYQVTRRPPIRQAFVDHVARLGVPFVIHDKGRDFFRSEIKGSVNSSIGIDPQRGIVGVTHKRKLVPFGEYVPLTNDVDALRSFRMGGQLRAGRDAYLFDLGGMRIQPIICYETQFGRFVAETVGADATGKLLLAQSNDGWFGGDQVFQHLSSDRLRAVETRLPLVHVMNDGPSEVVDAAGRIVLRTPHQARGAYLAQVPYDAESGGTFFTRFPHAFVNGMRIAFGLLLMGALRRRRRARDDI